MHLFNRYLYLILVKREVKLILINTSLTFSVTISTEWLPRYFDSVKQVELNIESKLLIANTDWLSGGQCREHETLSGFYVVETKVTLFHKISKVEKDSTKNKINTFYASIFFQCL